MFFVGKSKQNASQRNKDGGKQQPFQQQSQANQKQQQQQQQQPATVVSVPPTQPPKSNSKTSKMKEINTKGANKEGTDMDAFNDNTTIVAPVAPPTVAATIPDVVNANVAPPTPIAVVTNDNFNVNPVILNTTNNTQQTNVVIANNKTNDVINAKSETTKQQSTLPVVTNKPKVDVTSIVKENKKPLITTTPQAPTVVLVPQGGVGGAVDETDSTATIMSAAEKIVQVKNEVNAKSGKENVAVVDGNKEKPQLPYKKGRFFFAFFFFENLIAIIY